jgi:hypothetical protein
VDEMRDVGPRVRTDTAYWEPTLSMRSTARAILAGWRHDHFRSSPGYERLMRLFAVAVLILFVVLVVVPVMLA